MRTRFTVDSSAAIEELAGEHVVKFRITDASAAPWTLGLCMLKERLVESIAIRWENGSFNLQVVPDLGRAQGRIQRSQQAYAGDIAIEEIELDRWVHFFLCYLRDGYGSVDHLDVDLDLPLEPIARGTLVLYVPHAAPPVSQAEALRR